MARLEELTQGASVRGVLREGVVTVVDAKWHGDAVVELTYKDAAGGVGQELLYRDREPTLEIVQSGRPWAFDGDGHRRSRSAITAPSPWTQRGSVATRAAWPMR